MKNYLEVTYGKKPFSTYPTQLATYIVKTFPMWIAQTSKLLDLGCGRGEYLEAFNKLYYANFSSIEGYDSDPEVRKLIDKKYKIKIGSSCPLPYKNNTFHIVFCKSVLEHQYYPEKLIKEVYRILAPGGKFIVLVPDLDSLGTGFWVDFTHRTPFTIESLKDILEIHNFRVLWCKKFVQLPFLWNKPKWLTSVITSICALFYTRNTKNKLIKFSKEKMILAVGGKPYDIPSK